jgi:hypothetical protein
MLFLFTKYRSLTFLSFESFHIGLVREMFTPRQSTVNEVTRGITRSIPMMLCGLLSNLLWVTPQKNSSVGGVWTLNGMALRTLDPLLHR